MSGIEFVIIDSSGEILKSCVGTEEDMEDEVQPGQTAVIGIARDNLHWIDPNTLQRQNKKIFPTVVLGQTISGIPPGTRVVGREIDQIIPDTVLNYFSNRKGRHRLILSHREYLTQTVELII